MELRLRNIVLDFRFLLIARQQMRSNLYQRRILVRTPRSFRLLSPVLIARDPVRGQKRPPRVSTLMNNEIAVPGRGKWRGHFLFHLNSYNRLNEESRLVSW